MDTGTSVNKRQEKFEAAMGRVPPKVRNHFQLVYVCLRLATGQARVL